MELSLADEVALLPDDERDEILAGLDPEHLAYDWSFWGRPKQLPPEPDDWRTWLLSAGRGFGKTATEVEWLRKKIAASPHPLRIALAARTAADVRDVLITGESGILARFPPSEAPLWEPSKRLLTFPDRSTALVMSSEEPSQARGPQFHVSLCDELAAWRWLQDDSGLTLWDNIQIATRLGDNPQLVVATTPKRIPQIKKLLADARNPDKRIRVTHGSTNDNLGNLSAAYIDEIYGQFEGTRLARQELEGILLEDVEGALWTSQQIAANRVDAPPPVPLITVVAVDPSVADAPTDNCGIVVIGATAERDLYRRHAYVLEDRTVHGSPQVWADAVTAAARDYAAPVVAEVNQGGALVSSALTATDPNIRVLPVRARYGKLTRAEPIALATDQGRIHHVGYLPELEDELTTWDPDRARKSPDRLDALVHGATALLIAPPAGLYTSPITARAPRPLTLSPLSAAHRAAAAALSAPVPTAAAATADPSASPFTHLPGAATARNRRRRARTRTVSAAPPRRF